MRPPLPGLRGAVRRALHGALPVWYHPTFRLPLSGLEAATGLDPRRADHVLAWLVDSGIVRERDVHEAPLAAWAWLRDVHDPEWLAALDRPEVVAPIVAMDPRRIATGSLIETWRRATGGLVAAVDHVLERGGRAAVLLGGFHHAARARGHGFCAINDVAVAVRCARDDGLRGRIVVLDLDAHPPDGTSELVAGDADVALLSIGVASAWSCGPCAIDERVPPGSGDDVYLAALDRLLARLGGAELAIVLAGADPLAGDRFGGLACTEAGLRERERRVLRALGRVPTVLVPAGGYTPGAWRVFAHAVAEAAGARATVPEGYDPVLRRTRWVSRTLDPAALGESPWLTADDLAEVFHQVPSEPRLLSYYTRQGIEYALDRQGILPTLRRMGFEDLDVELRAGSLPHRVLVTARIGDRREALVDLLVAIRRVDRFDTLFVEWLALRDPRAPARGARARLPGQEAPGLGMAEEAGHLLVRTAERLGLAGVSFVPAHYHVAWMGRGRFVFADPVARGRFRALARRLDGVALAEASARLDDPGLPVVTGEPVRWEPSLMVAPVDPELVAWLNAGEPAAEAAAAELGARLA